MHRRHRNCLAALLSMLLAARAAHSQVQVGDPRPADKCDSLCIAPARTISFETTKGTLMNVDVSPDGTTLLFDLLGDLYTVPRAGGAATRITSGMAMDLQPVFSPDGKQILFTSDRTGSTNLWVVNADGTNLRALTKERATEQAAFKNPEWSPDGEYVIVDKNNQLWLYSTSGGAGMELAKSLSGTHYRWAPGGRYIYFMGTAPAAANTPGQIRRLDRVTGDVAPVTATPIGGARPAVSRDGKWLAYVSTVDAKSGLRLRNLETDEDQWLAYPIDFEAERHRTRFTFTPDGNAVVFVMRGTFHEADVRTRQVKPIVFSAKVEQQLGKLVYHEFTQPTDSFAVRNVRYAGMNRDRKLVFGSLNQIWTMDLPSGTPRTLVQLSGAGGQYQPAFSPDGATVAYVTWDEATGGHLWTVPSGGGPPKQLSKNLAYYANPTWSADGSKIAYVREDAAVNRTRDTRTTAMIEWIPNGGGTAQQVVSAPSDNTLTFTSDGTRITYSERDSLKSVRLDGTDKRTLARVTAATKIVPSPDAKWVAFTVREEVYVAMLPLAVEPPTITESTGPGPVKRVTRSGGQDLKWVDAHTLTWVFANKFYRLDVDKALAPGAPVATVSRELADVIPVTLMAPLARPTGTVALKGATIVTMRGDEVLKNATIVVKDNRIADVGTSVKIPSGARVIDVAGKTIVPGLIDMHAHIRGMPRDVLSQAAPEPLVNLAFGVTMARDVNISTDQFHYREMIAAGHMVGPRSFVTGPSMVTSAVKVENYEDALAGARRYGNRGSISIKQYLQPQRRQIQWMLQGADEAGINATAEGGGIMHEVAMVLDGYTGFEHAPSDVVNVYDDVVQLFAQSKTLYTPTLIVASPAAYQGELFWYQSTAPHEDAKLTHFLTHDALDKFTRRSTRYAEDEYYFVHGGAGAAPVLKAGGKVAVGGHGQLHGIAVHWEMWMLRMTGMTNHEVLRAATIIGAEGLGMKKDFGSLEVGKVADLLVMDKSPLDDIRNSTAIKYVMQGGQIYDANTLATIWPKEQPLKPFLIRDFGPPPKSSWIKPATP